MLPDSLKQTIQSGYTAFLDNKGLRARGGQKRMIADIANALHAVEVDDEGRRVSQPAPICVVEAGTGTGKTIAYLVSVLPVARALGKQVVIATATVALQEQIMFKDLPDLQANTDMDFSYALAKGRGRYLCMAKLDNALKAGSSQQALFDLHGVRMEGSDARDGELHRRMLKSLQAGSWQGDRDDWPEALPDQQWRTIAVDNGQCAGSRCSHYNHCCFFRSRHQLQKADCIVANQDLVLADLNLGGGVVLPDPEDTIYVFDEAHHLPAKGTSHFSHFIQLRATNSWLEQLDSVFRKLGSDSGNAMADVLEEAAEAAAQARKQLAQDYSMFEQIAERIGGDDRSNGSRQYTFEMGVVDSELRELSENLAVLFSTLDRALERIVQTVRRDMEADGGALDREQAESWYPVVGGIQHRCEAASATWSWFAREDPEERAPCARWIRYAGTREEPEITVSVSPVLAAAELEEMLWRRCFAAVLTSATLSALGSFEFLQMRTGLPEGALFRSIPSPFDFARAGVLQVPERGFDPADSDAHTRAIVDALPELVAGERGVLMLFSSRRQLNDVSHGLDDSWRECVLSQDDYSKQRLLELHRERVDAGKTSVIFGLASLTEGIDLPGVYCSHVIIAKIPFSVPNEPVEATLAQWVKRCGGNPFSEISVPEAAMRLVQASGRLLRNEHDSGRITILDQRLLSRGYGRKILDSLPPYRRQSFTAAESQAVR